MIIQYSVSFTGDGLLKETPLMTDRLHCGGEFAFEFISGLLLSRGIRVLGVTIRFEVMIN